MFNLSEKYFLVFLYGVWCDQRIPLKNNVPERVLKRVTSYEQLRPLTTNILVGQSIFYNMKQILLIAERQVIKILQYRFNVILPPKDRLRAERQTQMRKATFFLNRKFVFIEIQVAHISKEIRLKKFKMTKKAFFGS